MADSIPPPPPPPPSSHERLDAEISLLQAMYPDTLTFNTHTREVHYKSTSTSPASAPSTSTSTSTSTCNASATATLVLRIPSDYPDTGLPELISARDGNKDDVRDKTRRALTTGTSALALEEGVEVLDQIITVFEDVVASSASSSSSDQATSVRGATTSTTNNNNHHHEDPPGKRQAATAKTVIIWLHHLLATSKRKLAIAPTTTMHMHARGHESISISGLTKPGYPGIMLFSGPRDLVDAHVQELKALNWQAFQVRYDSDEEQHPAPASSSSSSTSTVASTVEWPFTHERGKIIEVESMADLVRGIAREQDKEAFLRAVGVK
ncbi:hypothetical protein LTR14_002177 [Exophiala xenobiotica]|nr:hypothetical protein LTR14_002177 [Exophiala xenobiotica]